MKKSKVMMAKELQMEVYNSLEIAGDQLLTLIRHLRFRR